MKKYKVGFIQTETFVIDVTAEDRGEAITKAEVKFEELEAQGLEHHYGTGQGGREVGTVYDVTDTDDPFNE